MSLPPDAPGTKFDNEKFRWTLLPYEALEWVVAVLEYGARKYAPGNWRKVEADRYQDALFRHWADWQMGEALDPESQLPHLAHIACNALILCALKLGRVPKVRAKP